MVLDYKMFLVVVLIGALIFSAARGVPGERSREEDSEEKDE
jgi:hypothetical protein